MSDNENVFSGRRPMSSKQIERRTLSREELDKWMEESSFSKVDYRHYRDTEEQIPISVPGDDYLIFVGKSGELTAKIWTIIDRDTPHTAFILRPTEEIKYRLGSSEGVLLRFQFTEEVRIFNKNELLTVIEGGNITVFQKNDDVIIKIDNLR
ncbi:MAG: hypothetical protein IKO53_05550 [Lachnospiraceae bacterium]|nr:hypothetical protein [Lachnospiraceae bacterium]